ncbi:glyoxalase family protein [Nocardioidaceae bacterium Broad-1]|nr:glyoxalase family protein [Nocardioidaceae bacterium Broad-1]
MVDLFAGLPVTSLTAAVPWYEKLLGEVAFHPNEVEAVFEAAEHRYVYVEQKPEIAGHGFVTLFVDDLDARLAAIADRGLRPESEETYENGVRKTIFRDPDGNEIGIGGGPVGG